MGLIPAIFEGLSDDVIQKRGCNLLSRLTSYYPERFIQFAFLAVAYWPPGAFSVDQINQVTKEMLDSTIFGYWHFFNDEDAAQFLGRGVGSHRCSSCGILDCRRLTIFLGHLHRCSLFCCESQQYEKKYGTCGCCTSLA